MSGKGGGGGAGSAAGAALMLANPWLGLGMQMLGGFMGANNAQQGIDQLTQMSQYNPFSGMIGGAGMFDLGPGGGNAMMDPQMQALMNSIGGSVPGMLQGGPMMQNFWQGMNNIDMAGATGQAEQALQQQANPFYDQANFANTMSNVSNLGNMFTGNVAQGGSQRTQNMFGRGFDFLNQAQDVSGLINQNLDAARTLAAPEEARIANNYFDREFMGTRGATTGSQDRRFNEGTMAQMRDAQRVMNAQQLGQSEQQMLLGAGQGMLGLGQQNYGQEIGAAQGFNQMSAALENQGFMQGIQALQQNQSAGMQRLQNAMGMLNLGNSMFGQNYGLGLQGFGGMSEHGLGFASLVPQLLNADANRIGAQGYFAQPLAQLYGDKGSFLSGMFG